MSNDTEAAPGGEGDAMRRVQDAIDNGPDPQSLERLQSALHAEKDRKIEHGYGDTSDCLCGRNFATVRGLREHMTKARLAEHHPNCYQRTGVPDDLPPGLCDCRVLRMIDERATPSGKSHP